MSRNRRRLLTVALGGVIASSRPAMSEDGYDPLGGMDPDGRIPSVDKAALVDHPERWRYLPESRIPPGNVFDRFLVSSLVFPVFFFNSDVGTEKSGLVITSLARPLAASCAGTTVAW